MPTKVIINKVPIKCPVKDCKAENVIRGCLSSHLHLEHGWSIKKVEAYLNKEEI